MEILIGMLASLLTQVIKKIVGRYDREITTYAIYGIIFLCAIAWAVIKTSPTVQAYVQVIISIFTSAIATYEVVLKRVGSALPPPPLPSHSDDQTDAGGPAV